MTAGKYVAPTCTVVEIDLECRIMAGSNEPWLEEIL